jgi:hypothetical protein
MTSLGTFSSCLICNVDVAELAMTCPTKNGPFGVHVVPDGLNTYLFLFKSR